MKSLRCVWSSSRKALRSTQCWQSGRPRISILVRVWLLVEGMLVDARVGERVMMKRLRVVSIVNSILCMSG